MGIYNWLKAKTLAKFSAASTPNFFNPNATLPEASRRALVDQFRSWVFTASTTNGSAVANVPLRLYATTNPGDAMPRSRGGRGGKNYRELDSRELKDLQARSSSQKLLVATSQAQIVTEILDHPFLDLMKNINPYRDQFEFFEETTIFGDLTGDSFWYVVKDALGTPIELYLLPSQYVRIVPSKTKMIKGYLYGRNQTKQVAFTVDEIIHFRRPNPLNQLYGMGCVEATWGSVSLHNSMNEYEFALNKNMGVPSTVINYNGQIAKDDIKRLEREWNLVMSGIRNSGKVKVVSEDFNVKTLALAPRDMGYKEGRKYTKNDILNAFGIPISMVETENVNKANAQAGNEQYARRAVLPRIRRMENKLNQSLIPMYNEPRLFVAFDNPVPEDEAFELSKSNQLYTSRIITRGEARQEMGYNPEPMPGDDTGYYEAPTTQAGTSSESDTVITTDDEV